MPSASRLMDVAMFNGIQAAALIYGFWRGGQPERIIAVLLLSASISTLLVPAHTSAFHSVFWPVLWIDIVLLLGLVAVAAFADRFWPMWIAACQLLTIAGHGVRAYEPGLWALAYWFIIVSIAYPMLGLLVVGAWRHHRRLPSGREFSWTVQRHRHEDAASSYPTLHR